MNKLEQILTDVGHPEVYKKLKEVGVTKVEQLFVKTRRNPNFLKDFGIEDPMTREKIITSLEGESSKITYITIFVCIVLFIIFYIYS